ncbi:hypothetical protein [Polyangium sp. y55x31]|uniref:hypothetical protein n=1 Tax=Polyangium sp. y55x31 TaxID=3042688 RepID=UPI0024830AE7|nr:hypothetical protein [Polyangium sp. y55x31]MDI1480758.1 hypothetical protein [Polyangium sp. y55x31]
MSRNRFFRAVVGSLFAVLGTGCFAFVDYHAIYEEGKREMRIQRWPQADELFASIPDSVDIYDNALARRAEVASAQVKHELALQFWRQAAQISPDKYGKTKNRGYHRDYAKMIEVSTFEQPGDVRALFVTDDLLISHTKPSTLTAYDRKTKRPAWSYQIEKATEADWSRRVFAGGALVGMHEGSTGKPVALLAIDAQTGQER